MRLIKLHTINSTNSFLKDLVKNSPQENYTVVVTNKQTLGRGQMQQQWQSTPFKNLTFSVFISFSALLVAYGRYLNFAISLAVFDVLLEEKIAKLNIKWPNDILAENQKICGILIENQLQKDKITSSVIGIGLNVNQINFEGLPNATSLKNVLKKEFDLDDLLKKIINKLKEKIKLLEEKQFTVLEEDYLQCLYKYQTPSMFKDVNDRLFMGKIVGISSEGKLQIEFEDENIQEFGIKEVKFIN